MSLRLPDICLLFFFSFSLLHSQNNSRIEIHNNSFLTDEQVQQIVLSFPDSILNTHPEQIIKQLYQTFQDEGYFNSLIVIEHNTNDTNSAISLSIDQRERSIIRKIIVAGNDSSKVLNELSALLSDNYFSRALIESSINSVLIQLENRGYPFASLKIDQVVVLDSLSQIDLFLSLDHGKYATIDGYEIIGNTSTKDFVIIRQLRFPPNAEYKQEEISAVPAKLNKLRLFTSVSEPEYYLNQKDEGILRIRVAEKNSNSFDGVIGYVPSAKENESAYFTGLVNVQLKNLFGTGRAAMFRWQKLDRSSSEIELLYFEPWIAGYPFSADLQFKQRQQDSTYLVRNLNAKIEYAATDELSLALQIGYQKVIPSLRDIPVFTVYNSSALSTGFQVTVDTRDDPLAPSNGILFRNQYVYEKKNISGPSQYITSSTETNSNQQRFAIGFEFYQKVSAGQTVALRLNGRELRGGKAEISDFYRIGGTNSIRGYRENQFTGQRAAWGNLEYRLALEKRSYLFAFFDYGYYRQFENQSLKISALSGYLSGYGLGITIETNLGLLAVSYAMGRGDTFSQGKIHFGISNEF